MVWNTDSTISVQNNIFHKQGIWLVEKASSQGHIMTKVWLKSSFHIPEFLIIAKHYYSQRFIRIVTFYLPNNTTTSKIAFGRFKQLQIHFRQQKTAMGHLTGSLLKDFSHLLWTLFYDPSITHNLNLLLLQDKVHRMNKTWFSKGYCWVEQS